MSSFTFDAVYGSIRSASLTGGRDPIIIWAGNRDTYTYRLEGYATMDGEATPVDCESDPYNFGCQPDCSGDSAEPAKWIYDNSSNIRWNLALYKNGRKRATYFLCEYAADEFDTYAACCHQGGANETDVKNIYHTGRFRYYLFLHPLVPKLTCYIEVNTSYQLIGNTPVTNYNARIVYGNKTIGARNYPTYTGERGIGSGGNSSIWWNSASNSADVAITQAIGAVSWAAPTAFNFGAGRFLDAHWGNLTPRVTGMPYYSGGISGMMLSGLAGSYSAGNARTLSVLKYGAVHPHKVDGEYPYMFALRKFEFNNLAQGPTRSNRIGVIIDENYNESYYQNPTEHHYPAFRIGAFNEWEYQWESNVMELDELRVLCEKDPDASPFSIGVL